MKTYHKASIIKAAWQEHKNKQRDQNKSQVTPYTHTHTNVIHNKGDTLNHLITNGLTNK